MSRWPARVWIVLGLSASAGLVGLRLWPWPSEHPLAQWVAFERPALADGLAWAYVVLWFSTPLVVFTVGASMFTIFLARTGSAEAFRALPDYPPPEMRDELFLVLGEQHYRTTPVRAPRPQWLTIPERGLYTGIAVIGATGSGKSAGAMFPYVEQLLGYAATDPSRRVSGLVLEVKGDFCRQVQAHAASIRSTERLYRGELDVAVSVQPVAQRS